MLAFANVIYFHEHLLKRFIYSLETVLIIDTYNINFRQFILWIISNVGQVQGRKILCSLERILLVQKLRFISVTQANHSIFAKTSAIIYFLSPEHKKLGQLLEHRFE